MKMSEMFASISGAMCDCAGRGGGGCVGPRGVLSSTAAAGLLLSYGVHASLAVPAAVAPTTSAAAAQTPSAAAAPAAPAAAAPTPSAAAAPTTSAAAAPTIPAAAAPPIAAALLTVNGVLFACIVAGACPSSVRGVSLTGASCAGPAVGGVGTEPSSAGPMKEATPSSTYDNNQCCGS
jgi:hypothetical protein